MVVAAAPKAPFLLAAARRPAGHTPVWFMRQAGRYLPEYRAIRAKTSLLEICARPELAAEVTLQPVRRLGVDAAILFADILLPLVPMGLELRFAAGEGPVIGNPLRTPADIARLRAVNPREDLAATLETVRLVHAALEERVALIGFAGGPFTVASYAIEGGSSRHFAETKRLMYGAEEAWHDLLARLAAFTVDYLAAQVEAGAQAVQVFDSWVGCLSASDYRRFVLPHSQALFSSLRRLGVPAIHFGVGTAHLIETLAEAGGEIIGIDWRTPLSEARLRLPDHAIQGNLDPAALLAPWERCARETREVLRQAGNIPGHIFNLGHGILPQTPVDTVRRVVDLVHELTEGQS